MKPTDTNTHSNVTTFKISRSPMNHSNISATNNSQSNIGDIIQIPLFVLIIILAVIYTILVLSRRILRANKFNWLTINVCLAIILFSAVQLFSTGIGLSNISETVISCRPKGFIINMATSHIMYSHSIASFCRLLSIKYPQKLLFRSHHWLLSNIAVSWIIGLLLALPYLFFDGFTCSTNYGQQFLKIYTFSMTIILPIIIVTVCNLVIFRYVRQSTKRIQDSNNNHNNQLGKRDMHVCRIMLLTFCVFVIGWTPIFCEQIFFKNDNRLSSGVTIFFKILPPVSLLADMILIIYSDQPVRNILLKAFKCHGLQHV